MVALRTKLAAVMEALVHAAVAELKKLVEGSFSPDKLPSDTWETMVRIIPRSEKCLCLVKTDYGGHHIGFVLMKMVIWRMSDAFIRCSLLPSWRLWGTRLLGR